MNGLRRRWVLNESDSDASRDGGVGRGLRDRILASRGLCDPAAIDRFCTPRLTDLHDPGLLPQVDLAAQKLVETLKAGHTIAIFGDYDVDGMTATAILYHVIKAVQPDASIVCYVPHRLEEGYGINCDALRKLHEQGVKLVVSVDCGITATEPAQTARELGMDLIITDHHNLPEDGTLPEAVACVHPRLPGGKYPFGELCGAGVAFKLAWRFATLWCGSDRVGKVVQQVLLDVLPLVALGTVADVVPLIDENRVLTSFGLRWMKQTPLTGLKALIEAAGLLDEAIDSEKIGFVLGPRLNACGRMGHSRDAVHMLTSATPEEAGEIAERLTRLNDERRKTERKIFEQAVEQVLASGMDGDHCRAIVLADERWHPGVIGIVCSRLVERFGRPTILLQLEEGECRGSGRSIEGYSIHEGLIACTEHLATFGGHDFAAGLRLSAENLDAFRSAFVEHANGQISIEQLTASLPIDCDARFAELTVETVNDLAVLGPFGKSNRRPTVRVQNVVISEAPRTMGAYGKHLSLRLKATGDSDHGTIRTVWWNAGSLADELTAGMRLDVAIEPKINTWNGRTSVEAELRDIFVYQA